MRLVDSHCHLPLLAKTDGDLDRIVLDAKNNGIEHILSVSIDLETYDDVLRTALRYPEVSASVGVHPNCTRENLEPNIDKLVRLGANEQVIAIGETGLDFFYEDLHLIVYYIIVLTSFLLFFSFNNDFSTNLLSVSSSISNIGFSISTEQSNLTLIFLILVIIGGSFFSTSSGIRFLKLYVLFKFSINNLISHVKPKNVSINKQLFSEISFDKIIINKYFLSVVIFIISLLFLSSFMTFFGISFENSFKISVLTLMNTVNSAMYGVEDFDFQKLQFIIKYFLIIFMIIGRVELLTILIILKKFLFKN